ncbi:TraU family protein [Vibrio gangliei]|uniref:TraU family protein n=1 Tax=Vibrio gangliei TaxID=2077090 RepID=UPI000D019B51|nr:TraU family protein [Vibrio gangliei]
MKLTKLLFIMAIAICGPHYANANENPTINTSDYFDSENNDDFVFDKDNVFSEDEEDSLTKQLATDYSSSINMECVDVKVLGVCVWITVTPFSVDIDYSPVVSMYSPDAKVEVFHTKDNTPYVPAKLNNKLASAIGGGIGSSLTGFSMDNLSSSTEGYRSVHIMGNPVLSAHQQTIGTLLDAMELGYCSSTVQPFMTYFHSDIDFYEWRSGMMEQIFYPMNILRRITNSSTGSLWGTLYPRTGWTMNSSPYIGASVAAVRAASIVNENQGDSRGLHIYTAMPKNINGARKLEDPKVDQANGKWQPMNIGASYMQKCSTFPTPNINIGIGTNEPIKVGRAYYYTLWRNYICCTREGNSLVSAVY